MNKARLIRNRLTIVWSGISKIMPISKSILKYDRRKLREKRKGVFTNKIRINNEFD